MAWIPLDERNKPGADIVSDHHLLTANIRLKIALIKKRLIAKKKIAKKIIAKKKFKTSTKSIKKYQNLKKRSKKIRKLECTLQVRQQLLDSKIWRDPLSFPVTSFRS